MEQIKSPGGEPGQIQVQGGGNERGNYSTNSPYLALFARLPEQEQAALLAQSAQRNTPSSNGAAPASGEIAPLSIIKGSDLMKQHFDPFKFLVDKLIVKGHFIMLGGRPKSGKSWLALQLAAAVDQGEPFLGLATTPGRVLYIALEDGMRRVYQRCHLLRWQMQNAGFAFHIANFDGKDGPGPGLAQIDGDAANYDLIIIDTLVATLGGGANENDNVQMGTIANALARIAHETNTAIVLVHHTGKAQTEDVFLQLRGASALRGAYDLGLVLKRDLAAREATLFVESRDFDAASLAIRQTTNNTGWVCLGSGSELAQLKAGRAIVELMTQHGDGLTIKELASRAGKSEATIRQQLNGAEERGLVCKKEQQASGPTKPAATWYLTSNLPDDLPDDLP